MAKDAYTTFIKNFGKSIAYSSLEVLKSASPNLTEIGSQAMEEAQALRDTLAEARTKNPMQIRTMDLSKIQKDVKGVIDSTIEDLRTGNLSAPREMDLDDFLGDDEDFGLDEATENESPESVAKGASLEAKVSVASANMLNATIAESSRSSITAQANVARAMIRSSQNLTLTQTKHLGAAIQQTNAHLAQINQNLVSIINFMNQNQSVVNQATLKFMDQGQAYMKAHMAILQPPKKKQSGNNQLNFMTGNSFNLSDYIKYVKSNIKNNDAISSMQAMGSMAGMAGNMMSSFGLKNTVRPTQMAMNALMGMIIPKNIQRAIKNVDALLPSAITAGLANLGDIGERDYGIKGSIAKVLGVSSKRLKTVNLGDYNKGAVPWDGTSKKALEEVIPTLLGLIEAHTRTLDPGGSQDAKIYDYNRGVFTTVNKASADLKNKGTEMKWDAMKGIRGLLDAKDQDGQLVMGYAQRKEVLKVLDKYFQEATVDARLQNPDADDRALREIQKDLQKDLLALKVDPAQVRMYSFQFASAVGQYVNSVRMWAPDMSQTYRQALALTADTDAFGNAKFDSKFYGSFADETERMKAQRKKQEEIDNRARQMSKDLKGITDRFSRDDGGETGYSLPKRLLKQLLLLPSTGVFGSSETTKLLFSHWLMQSVVLRITINMLPLSKVETKMLQRWSRQRVLQKVCAQLSRTNSTITSVGLICTFPLQMSNVSCWRMDLSLKTISLSVLMV